MIASAGYRATGRRMFEFKISLCSRRRVQDEPTPIPSRAERFRSSSLTHIRFSNRRQEI